MSPLEFIATFLAVWVVGVFVVAFIVGRLDLSTYTDGEPDAAGAVAIALGWPVFVPAMMIFFVIKGIVRACEGVVRFAFNSGHKARRKQSNPAPILSDRRG